MNKTATFSIELNNPKYVLPSGKGHDLMTVFSVCFEFPNDNFEMTWNGIVISCSYDYMVAHFIYEVLDMLNAISSKKKGECAVMIGTNGLQTDWQVRWNKDDLQIESIWNRAPVESLETLNQRSMLETTTHSFLLEWQQLIKFLIKIIEQSAVKIVGRGYTYKYLLRVEKKVAKRLDIISNESKLFLK